MLPRKIADVGPTVLTGDEDILDDTDLGPLRGGVVVGATPIPVWHYGLQALRRLNAAIERLEVERDSLGEALSEYNSEYIADGELKMSAAEVRQRRLAKLRSVVELRQNDIELLLTEPFEKKPEDTTRADRMQILEAIVFAAELRTLRRAVRGLACEHFGVEVRQDDAIALRSDGYRAMAETTFRRTLRQLEDGSLAAQTKFAMPDDWNAEPFTAPMLASISDWPWPNSVQHMADRLHAAALLHSRLDEQAWIEAINVFQLPREARAEELPKWEFIARWFDQLQKPDVETAPETLRRHWDRYVTSQGLGPRTTRKRAPR